VLDFTVIVAVAQFNQGYLNESCQSVVPHSCLGIASALYLQPRTVALTSLVYFGYSLPAQTVVNPVATVVSYRVCLPESRFTYHLLPPSLSAQYLFNTDIYNTYLHTQADSWLFNVTQ
jgi:hypothetical protein